MAVSELSSERVLECPFCRELMVVKPPDALRSAYTTKKPVASNYRNGVRQQKLQCPNSECGKQIIIYWYAPIDYFLRL
jgi:hypothetical protein